MLTIDDFPSPVRQSYKKWDRFIRSNHTLQQRFNSLHINQPSENEDALINKKLYSLSEETYKCLVAKALSVRCPQQVWTPQWPVRSRVNPTITSPSVVLDLPNINNDFCATCLVDWSVTDYLTVAFPRSVYLWHSPTNRTLRFPSYSPSCIKWDLDGKNLFIASKTGSLKIVGMGQGVQEEITNRRPHCHLNCYITCAAFHPKMPFLFVGCSKGAFSVYEVKKGMHLTGLVHDYTSAITYLAFSCDGKHLAVANMTTEVGVYSMTGNAMLHPHFVVNMRGPCRALAWHPWKHSCLVIADCHGFMALYNVLSPEAPDATYSPVYNSGILSMSFNPLSAELVISHRIFDTTSSPMTAFTQINVLASFDRVVDRLEGHTGRVNFLHWNPDGTRLASSGSDETARIWNFHSQSNKQRKKKTPCKTNYATAFIELGNKMGKALR